MKFIGLSRVFSTENDAQYEAIGQFWADMSAKYGIENLRGLGFNWGVNSIEYVIGLKYNTVPAAEPDAELKTLDLPDTGWLGYDGTTDRLAELYDIIYRDGVLDYEIETFAPDGSCHVEIFRY